MIHSTKESRTESLLRKIRNSAKGINEAVEKLEKAQLSSESTTKDATSDLISRQAAIDIVVFECGKWTGLAKEISKQLKQLPPVQPEPQEGHWIWVAGELMCSECRTIYSDLYPDYDNSVACPHCGAKMTISTK